MFLLSLSLFSQMAIGVGVFILAILFSAILYYRNKKERKREKEIRSLMEKLQSAHWNISSLGKPNDRDIIQHAPPSEGIIILGKYPSSGDSEQTFNPVFAAHTMNCKETLFAFSRNRSDDENLNPDNISSFLFAINDTRGPSEDLKKREKYLNELFNRYLQD